MLWELCFDENHLNTIKKNVETSGRTWEDFDKEVTEEVAPMIRHLLPKDFRTYLSATVDIILDGE